MRLLFVIPHPIDPPDRGNKHHTLNLLRRIAPDHDIDVVAFDEGGVERSAASWARVSAELPRVRVVLRVPKNSGARLLWEQVKSLLLLRPVVLGRYRRREVFRYLRTQGAVYDAICFDMFMTAEGRAYCKQAPGVLLVTDAYSMMIHRSRVAPLGWRRNLRLRLDEWLLSRFERSSYRSFERLLLVSEVDIRWLQMSAPRLRCELVPIPVESSVLAASPVEYRADQAPTVCCWAGVSNDAVASGIRDFLERAWPQIYAQVPGARCLIWGKSPHAVLDRVRTVRGVAFVDFVEDWIAELRKATVVVYPQRCGSGLQTKMQSAMALGLPCVLSPETVGGLPAVDGTTCMIRDSADGFADACTALLTNSSLRGRIGRAARAAVLDQHDPERIGRLFSAAVVAATRNPDSGTDQRREVGGVARGHSESHSRGIPGRSREDSRDRA